MTASPQTAPHQTRLRRLLPIVLINMLVLLALEGLASTISVVRIGIERMRPLGEPAHTRHDPELGCVAIPNLTIPDLYGPGAFLRANAQGFRNATAPSSGPRTFRTQRQNHRGYHRGLNP